MSPKATRVAQPQIESPSALLSLRNGSPRRHESPSRLTDTDLEDVLSSLQLRDHELARLHQYNRKCYTEDLEARDVAKAREHNHALEAVKRERDSIRAEAETALRQHLIQEEEERRRRQEEERLRRQREAEEKAERDRKILEEAERVERLRQEREAAEARRVAEQEARAKAEAEAKAEAQAHAQAQRKAKEEQERKQQEERDSVAREEATKKAAQVQANEAAAASKATPSSTTTAPGIEARHRDYLNLYQKVKKFKNEYRDELKSMPKEHRSAIGDARRDIRSGLGKLSADKKGNEVVRGKIEGTIKAAIANTSPAGRPLPVNNFLPQHLSLQDDNQQTISAAAAYLLAVFSQEAVKLFTQFAHGEAERADPIGTCIAALFAIPALQFERRGGKSPQKTSIFPMFLAKYHKVCPVLFGITADQNTPVGKAKLGWQLTAGPKDREGEKTALVTNNTHADRMKGLAFGYAAFALRNFSRSKNSNPYPPSHFWETVALINNLNPLDVQPTHLYVLRHIFGHNGLDRFLLFFGAPGVAAIRQAFVDMPNQLPATMQTNPERVALGQYVDETLAKKLHFRLS